MAEVALYNPVQMKLAELLGGTGVGNFLLETGGSKGFSEKLKAAIPVGREIVFNFLTRRPDILGYVEGQYQKDLVTVEVKEKSLKIDDIYQAKMYKEVFGARYGFLITAADIPEALKRLCATTPSILHSVDDHIYKFLAIAQYHPGGGFIDWVPENPFDKDFFWK
jgi:hypothetical protein